MFLYFDDRIKPARVFMGMLGTEIVFGFAIVIICPMMNLFQYQLFTLSHQMFGVYPSGMRKKWYSQLNGLFIIDAHSSTSDGKILPFGWKVVVANVLGYTMYVLPLVCIFIPLAATSLTNDPSKSFIAPLQLNATVLALVVLGIWVCLIILSLFEQIAFPGKWHSLAKMTITIVFSMSIMILPMLCSNISNMKLICLMNSKQEVCAEVRSEITCNSESYNNIGLQYTTEGNKVVKNYFLNATGPIYFKY